ncbi:hypothetical protein [Pedobacter sp. L105]|uniref:hypothetical protein n=1 Tax=Pedobacter sp. L105 TaxID=1641871 RepID=UPI00131C3624|nr:hypothetical protein [Pedobacter sp. L105]
MSKKNKNTKELRTLAKGILDSFEAVKTEDGQDLNLSSREVGGEVTEGADAEPVPDKTWVLDDGFSFSTVDSLIETIESSDDFKAVEEVKVIPVAVEVELAVTPVEPAPAAQDVAPDAQLQLDALKSIVVDLTQQLEGLIAQFSALPKYATVEEFTAVKEAFEATPKYLTEEDLTPVKEQFSTLDAEVKVLSNDIKIVAKSPAQHSQVSSSFKQVTKKEEDMKRLQSVLGSK